MTKLELDSVGWTFPGAERPTLSGISCTVSAGEFITLTGANGSGKTTLARLITGLIEPTEGVIHGRRDEDAGWNGVALVMQEPSAQFVTASVEAEIAWGLENLQIERSEIARRVEASLSRFGLESLRKRPPESLADGECQLVAFVANFVMKPDVMIFDEATAFLDLKWRRIIRESAEEAAKEAAIIWITTGRIGRQDRGRVWGLEHGKMEWVV